MTVHGRQLGSENLVILYPKTIIVTFFDHFTKMTHTSCCHRVARETVHQCYTAEA